MPYIPEDERHNLNLMGRNLGAIALGPGRLNFALTTAILAYLGPNPHYRDFNEVIGVLECIKLELYRRVVAPYERTKCSEHGDVYPEPES